MIIRKASVSDAYSIARVNIDTWKTAYSGIISQDYLDSLSYKKKEKIWEDILKNRNKKSFIYVAQDENRNIIGFACAGLERSGLSKYNGELHAIYVLKKYQRRGTGKSLFLTIFKNLYRMNIKNMIVWVLKNSRYRTFYESLQGKNVGEKKDKIGDKNYDLVAYGWDNIDIIE